ncbi:MAG: tetratricopeptide repeat protein [Myxococcales bacterium]|nr:tetratricopeptide repeat protein [Myxococcales bacterium]
MKLGRTSHARRCVTRLSAGLVLVLAAGCATTPETNQNEDPDRYYRLGQILLVNGELDKAEYWLKKSEAIKADDPLLQNLLGLLYWGRGRREHGELAAMRQYEIAVPHLKRALELDPTFTKAENNLGVCLADMKRDDEAVEHFEHVLADRNYPTPEKVHNNVAVLYVRKGDTKKAIEHYKAAIDYQPSFIPARLGLGKLYYEMGRNGDAHRTFDAALQIQKKLPEAHYYIGLLFLRDGQGAIAKAAFEEAIRLSDNDTEVNREARKHLAALRGVGG